MTRLTLSFIWIARRARADVTNSPDVTAEIEESQSFAGNFRFFFSNFTEIQKLYSTEKKGERFVSIILISFPPRRNKY